MTYGLLVPHYNHARQFERFLPSLLATGLTCLVIDDGSEAEQQLYLRKLLAEHPQMRLHCHVRNRGKGAAVKSGLCLARTLGFSHVIQIDADGQHNLADLPQFIALSEQNPSAILSGKPTFDESVPKARKYGRRITDFWVALETLSLRIKDGLCGYRVYPLNEMESVLDRFYIGARMDFDTEVLVKATWLNIPLYFIKTGVIYPENNVSHFKYWRDNLVLIRLHTRLMFGMLTRFPAILWRRVRSR